MPTTLLAVDDSATMRKVLEMTFAGEQDVRVVTAEGADSALAKLRAERPGIVLADLGLEVPGASAPGGYGLCTRIKSESPSTPVILLASKQQPYDRDKGTAARADDSIEKPFDTQQLIDKVRKLLGKPAADQAKPAAVATAPGRPAAPVGPAQHARPVVPAAPARPAAAPIPPARPPAPSSSGAQPPHPAPMHAAVASAAGTAQPGAMGVPAASMARGPQPLPSGPVHAAPAMPGHARPVGGAVHAQPTPHAAPPAAVQRTADPASHAAASPAARPAAHVAASPAIPAQTGGGATQSPAAAQGTDVGQSVAAGLNGGFANRLANLGLTDVQVNAVLVLSRDVIERVVWEVVPVLAETLIKEEIKRLTSDS